MVCVGGDHVKVRGQLCGVGSFLPRLHRLVLESTLVAELAGGKC